MMMSMINSIRLMRQRHVQCPRIYPIRVYPGPGTVTLQPDSPDPDSRPDPYLSDRRLTNLHTPDLWLLMQIKYVLNILPNFHIYFIIFTFVLPNFDIQIHTEIMCFSKPKKVFCFKNCQNLVKKISHKLQKVCNILWLFKCQKYFNKK